MRNKSFPNALAMATVNCVLAAWALTHGSSVGAAFAGLPAAFLMLQAGLIVLAGYLAGYKIGKGLVPAHFEGDRIHIDGKLMSKLPKWLWPVILRHEQTHHWIHKHFPVLDDIKGLGIVEEYLVSSFDIVWGLLELFRWAAKKMFGFNINYFKNSGFIFKTETAPIPILQEDPSFLPRAEKILINNETPRNADFHEIIAHLKIQKAVGQMVLGPGARMPDAYVFGFEAPEPNAAQDSVFYDSLAAAVKLAYAGSEKTFRIVLLYNREAPDVERIKQTLLHHPEITARMLKDIQFGDFVIRQPEANDGGESFLRELRQLMSQTGLGGSFGLILFTHDPERFKALIADRLIQIIPLPTPGAAISVTWRLREYIAGVRKDFNAIGLHPWPIEED